MHLTNSRLYIGGMTCVNCQNKIERTLMGTEGISRAIVDYSKGTAEIVFDEEQISPDDIVAVIEKLGYEVLSDQKKAQRDISSTICLLVVIISLYILLQQFGILNLLVPGQLADTKMGYGMLFVVGLLTSVHCIAMCGGITLSQCIPKENAADNSGGLSVFRSAFLYNLGRVISYTVIGFLLGAVGMLIGGGDGTGLPTLLQGILKLIAGAFMVIMGINMLGIFPWLRKCNLRMPGFLAVKAGAQRGKSRQPLVIGLLNGLMPCGPLQSMQIVALASGNPFAGALSMFLFSLGTVPLMLGLGSIVSALGRKFTHKVMRIGAVLVVVLGLAMLSQGGSLSGLLLPDRLLMLIIAFSILGVIASVPFEKNRYKAVSLVGAAVIMVSGGIVWGNGMKANDLQDTAAAAEQSETVDGIQVVNSTLVPGRYPNITVQAGIPVKWIIDAPAGSINGCNYRMLLQEYGIEHTFQEGENIIEFMPEKAGTYGYTCWMGMIRGNIFVTDGNGTAASAEDAASDVPVLSGYQIPSEQLAVAELLEDDDGNVYQEVSIELTDEGFAPAVVVVQSDVQAVWNIHVSLSDAESGMTLLAPVYATVLDLTQGENTLYLYPSESFDVSTGDNRFYAYVKVVEDIDQIDMDAIRKEVDEYETYIYPASMYESAATGGSCCAP